MLYAESFALSEHIAACRVMGSDAAYATFKDAATCTFVDANLVLFTSTVIGCDMSLFDDPDNPDLAELGLMCYNAFSSAETLFSS